MVGVYVGPGHITIQTELEYVKPTILFAQSNIKPLKTKRRLLYLKTQFVPRSKHFSSPL